MKKFTLTALSLFLLIIPAAAQMVGIGITIDFDHDAEKYKISDVISGSAADKKDIKAGLFILAVNDIYVDELSTEEIYFLLCGEINSTAKVKINNSGTEKTINVKRAKDNNGQLSSEHEKAIIQGITGEGAAYDLEDIKERGRDTDGDGLPDSKDHCPNEPGKRENYGCIESPAADRDRDGVSNYWDKCPDDPGTDANDGCPEITPPSKPQETPATPAPATPPAKDNADRTSPFGSALNKIVDDAKNGFKSIRVKQQDDIIGTSWTVNTCLPDALACKINDGLTDDYDSYYAEFMNMATQEEADARWEEIKNKVKAALGSAYTAKVENTDYEKQVTFTAPNKPTITISSTGSVFYSVSLEIQN